MNFKTYIFLGLILASTGCQKISDWTGGLLNSSFKENEKPIARVHDKYLYQSDIDDLVPKRSSAEDSSNITNRYINSWVKQGLVSQKAIESDVIDEAELNRRIEEYKYQLLIYSFERKYISEHLDTIVTLAQIQEYYQNNPFDFELKRNIVKCYFLKVPQEAPQINDVEKWVKKGDSTSTKKLIDYAYTYADIYNINDSSWIDFEEIIQFTPFMEEITNQIQTLQKRKVLLTTDSVFNYYMKILDYKIVDEESPLGYVKNKVKDIIISKRKVELKKQLEQDMVEQAQKEGLFEVY